MMLFNNLNRKIIVVIFLSFNIYSALAQNTNFNLENMDFTNWNPQVGRRGDCCNTPAIGGNSHTIITSSGSDPIVGAVLNRLPEGATHVARLGSPAGGTNGNTGYGWKMSYNIVVDNEHPLLHYQVAVVGDNTHACNDMAHGLPLNTLFRYRLLNSQGQLLIPGTCSEYDLEPCKAGPFQMLYGWNTSSYYPWSSVGIDLKAYLGDTITIEFYYYTCYYHGYHGNSYAYLSPTLITEVDTIYFCSGATEKEVNGLPNFKSYNWSNGTNQRTTKFTNPKEGDIYTCIYGSFNGCIMNRKYYLKEIISTSDFTFSSSNLCNQIKFSDISSTTQGNIVNWLWDFGEPSSGNANTSNEQNPLHTYNSKGTFTVTLSVTTDSGCVATQTYDIDITALADSIKPSIKIPNVLCVKDTLIFEDITLGSQSRIWRLNDSILNTTDKSIPLYFDASGTHTLSMYIIGSQGCPDTTAQTFEIHDLPKVSISINPATFAAPISSPIFHLRGYEENASSYSWDFGWNNMTSEEYATQITYPNEINNYTITLQVTNYFGCFDTAQANVKIVPDDFYIPNAFSPNGDGINDLFKIANLSNHIIQNFSIYNRNGNRVFYTTTSLDTWDGNYLGKPSETGVYFYILNYKLPNDNTEYQLRGDITLLR